MIERDLTDDEIDTLLKSQCYAHIGYANADGSIGVLPISYVYDEGVFYSFSTKGSKIEAMRKNPRVCIQVEELYKPTIWRSVQAWGTFSEVGSKEIGRFNLLVSDFWRRVDKNDLIFSAFRDFMEHPSEEMTLYRVTVEKMIGKQGKQSYDPTV